MTNEQVLKEIINCANSWEPDARLLGNLRADQIVEAVSELLGRKKCKHENKRPRCLLRKKQYNSQEAAQKFADKRQKDAKPYKCRQCGKWHISTGLAGLISKSKKYNPEVEELKKRKSRRRKR